MGVTITDLTFMHAVTTQGEKDKAAYVKINGQMTSLQTDMEMAAALGYDIEVIMLFLLFKYTRSLLLFNRLL